MRVAAEPLEKPRHLLMHHRVARDAIIKVRLLRDGGQFAIEQEIAGLQKIAVLGDLLNGIAAIQQDAGVAVNVGDFRFRAGGRGKAGIIGEHAALRVELADIDDGRPDRAQLDRHFDAFIAIFQHCRTYDHSRSPLAPRMRQLSKFNCAVQQR